MMSREHLERKAERELVRRLRRGEEAAAAELLERYGDRLYRFALVRLGYDAELTREILQEALCRVVAKRWNFRGDARLYTWLCACCKNLIADHQQAKRRRAPSPSLDGLLEAGSGLLQGLAAPGDGPEVGLRRRELAEQVHHALDELPPHQARALEWKYLEGLPVQQIAERLEVSPKAAESLLTRARSAFRRHFGPFRSQPTDRAAAESRRIEVSR